jgi:hypothetical protein
MALMSHEDVVPAPTNPRNRRWQRRGLVLLCYLAPLLLLGLFYLPVEAGQYVFWRNWLRAGCGPVVQIMAWAGFDPNDLTTYAVAFSLLWPPWLLLVGLSLLHRLPLALHALAGLLWCLGGCCLTLAT